MNTLELNVFSDQILTIAKDVLTEKQYDVLVSRAIHKVTFKQIGIKYNVSPSRISPIILSNQVMTVYGLTTIVGASL